jgi:hypothetical protein
MKEGGDYRIFTQLPKLIITTIESLAKGLGGALPGLAGSAPSLVSLSNVALPEALIPAAAIPGLAAIDHDRTYNDTDAQNAQVGVGLLQTAAVSALANANLPLGYATAAVVAATNITGVRIDMLSGRAAAGGGDTFARLVSYGSLVGSRHTWMDAVSTIVVGTAVTATRKEDGMTHDPYHGSSVFGPLKLINVTEVDAESLKDIVADTSDDEIEQMPPREVLYRASTSAHIVNAAADTVREEVGPQIWTQATDIARSIAGDEDDDNDYEDDDNDYDDEDDADETYLNMLAMHAIETLRGRSLYGQVTGTPLNSSSTVPYYPATPMMLPKIAQVVGFSKATDEELREKAEPEYLAALDKLTAQQDVWLSPEIQERLREMDESWQASADSSTNGLYPDLSYTGTSDGKANWDNAGQGYLATPVSDVVIEAAFVDALKQIPADLTVYEWLDQKWFEQKAAEEAKTKASSSDSSTNVTTSALVESPEVTTMLDDDLDDVESDDVTSVADESPVTTSSPTEPPATTSAPDESPAVTSGLEESPVTTPGATPPSSPASSGDGPAVTSAPVQPAPSTPVEAPSNDESYESDESNEGDEVVGAIKPAPFPGEEDAVTSAMEITLTPMAGVTMVLRVDAVPTEAPSPGVDGAEETDEYFRVVGGKTIVEK